MPKRSKRVVLISHCLLNVNSRAYGLVTSELHNIQLSLLIGHLFRKGYGLVQLPCPEALVMGFKRKTSTKEEYEKLELRRYARKLAKEISALVNSMLSSGIEVVALIGVAGSPSCGVFTTHVKSELVREPGRGIFVEELLTELPSEVRLLEWDFRNPLKSLLIISK